MKFLKFLLMAMAALGAASVSAAEYGYASLSGLPATVASGATSNTTVTIDVRKMENLGLQMSLANGGSGTQNVTVTGKWSVDGTTFASAPTVSWVVAMVADTNTYTFATNVPTTGYGYFQISSIANGSGSTVTLDSIKASYKLLTTGR